MSLVVYSTVNSSRLQYTLDTVFVQFLGIRYRWTSNKQEYLNFSGPKINYSKERFSNGELFIPAGTFLFENQIHSFQPKVVQVEQIPALFPLSYPKADFSFDLFAMVFYLLSRYEEYLEYQADQHGRFTAQQSIAYQYQFLRRPLIDEWMGCLKQKIQSQFPDLLFPEQHFQFQPTYDIDLAWAFKHKGVLRSLASLLNKLKTGEIALLKQQVRVLLDQDKDPFFTYPYLEQLHQRYQLKPLYFFLLANYGRFDKNIAHKNPALSQLIQQIAKLYPVGIHPSYASNTEEKQISIEKERLERLINKKVEKSRQHYLKLHLPATYMRLIKYTIKEDYSMGYASDIGFRASTSKAFYWYNLDKECSTDLLVYPFQVMDVTLKNYLQLNPEEALETVKKIIHQIQSVNGTFSCLWHNSSLSALEGWKEWAAVYEKIVAYASQDGTETE